MPERGQAGRIVVDLQATQSPSTRDRGIGRYARNWVHAIETLDPGLVGAYLISPDLPPPGGIDDIVATGKVGYLADRSLEGVALWHSLSPFDLTIPLRSVHPAGLQAAGVRFSATVYDLIPALDPEHELADPVDRRTYRTRLELVRSADRLLTLSRSVARDLDWLAQVETRRINVVGGAADPRFVPAADRRLARVAGMEALRSHGLERPYVLATSGSHPRKNNEALIQAFCSLSRELLGRYQLVILGDVDEPTRDHYRFLAASAGTPGSVVVPGRLDDELVVALLQGADLSCVATLAEGFGLPIVEAQACAIPVICSDLPPFDELIDPPGRFDPTSIPSIAAAIERGLEDEPLRASLSKSRPLRWEAVAERSAAAFEAALAMPPRWRARHSAGPLRRHRPRLALVTPMPPAPSGVAGYSYSLVDALVRTEKVDVDVFAEDRDTETVVPDGAGLHRAAALRKIEALAGPYDDVVYAIGNSHHHLGALRLLRERPGVVLAHDVRLSNLYRHEHGNPGFLPGGLGRALQAMYPAGIPEEIGRGGELSADDTQRFGLLMAREVVRAARLVLVSSDAAAALARVDAGVGARDRIEVLPFAFASPSRPAPSFVEQTRPAPEGLTQAIATRWGLAAPPEGAPVIASFGIVDHQKLPALAIEALRLLTGAGAEAVLAFVGPISDELALELGAIAEGLGLAGRVVLTGPLPAEPYRRWLAGTDVAVQLRASSNGEASAAIGDCLAAGLATIVSDLGWSGELPDDVVSKLTREPRPENLAWSVSLLLADDGARASLRSAAARYASAQSFDRTARALLAALEALQRPQVA